MSLLKGKGKILLVSSFCAYLLLQAIAIHHRLTNSAKTETIDSDGYDLLASQEINQLERLWHKADIENLVTPQMIANTRELEQARVRLKRAELDIRESENRLQGLTGKRNEFFQKAHAYYYHSASALINIIDFLLGKKGSYSVKENEISFESENDAALFRKLIEQLSYLHREKEDLDAFILNHNREVEKKPKKT